MLGRTATPFEGRFGIDQLTVRAARHERLASARTHPVEPADCSSRARPDPRRPPWRRALGPQLGQRPPYARRWRPPQRLRATRHSFDCSTQPASASALHAMHRAGAPIGPLAGAPISVKDLYDVAGFPTTAASSTMHDAPIATRDSLAVARVRQAGGVLVGHTNMSEFAFSGVGINPHFGTPANVATAALDATPRAPGVRRPAAPPLSLPVRRWPRSAPTPGVRCVSRRRCRASSALRTRSG